MANLPYVDCHCHLDLIYERMKKDAGDSFDDFCGAWPAGFDGCLTAFSETFDGAMRFIGSGHAKIFGALGLHPHGASRYDDEFEARLVELLRHPQIRALGEIGLDHHYTLSPVDVQKRVFERQARLAVERGLPITIHMREAEADTLDILKRAVPRDHPFHIHCFTDTWAFAESVLREWPNSYFGFTGVLTFKTSKNVQEVCAKVPLDRLLSETDGPYMAPIPFRGKPAWPGHVPVIVKKMAALHNVTEEEAFRAVRENARKLYKF
jgi:TatD DNase family protein